MTTAAPTIVIRRFGDCHAGPDAAVALRRMSEQRSTAGTRMLDGVLRVSGAGLLANTLRATRQQARKNLAEAAKKAPVWAITIAGKPVYACFCVGTCDANGMPDLSPLGAVAVDAMMHLHAPGPAKPSLQVQTLGLHGRSFFASIIATARAVQPYSRICFLHQNPSAVTRFVVKLMRDAGPPISVADVAPTA